ncbi:hypothetical protein PV325_002302 [Microctonus aethiopoides]|nr:hypothetical protein PV325_002302 [Microctonus aethiopoides]KAK0091559.1 hypothetical protein PV326_003025 [Microctonus aethiopoides]
MERYEDEGGEDSDNETDPEQLLNEWLGELDSLTVRFGACKQGKGALGLALGLTEVGQGGCRSITWQRETDNAGR